jgi:fermentation-respiration switch protein FrsA (DUF1100 family)
MKKRLWGILFRLIVLCFIFYVTYVMTVQQPIMQAKTNPKKLYGVYPNYWLYANKYNALEAAKKIEKPILFLQGTRDYQVSMDNFNLWKSTMEGKNNAKFIHYENLNHLFMYGDSPSTPYEYSTKKTVEPSVADDIADWIKEVAE